MVVHALAGHGAEDLSALADLGWGLLCAAGPEDSFDLSLIARRAAEDSGVPFIVVHGLGRAFTLLGNRARVGERGREVTVLVRIAEDSTARDLFRGERCPHHVEHLQTGGRGRRACHRLRPPLELVVHGRTMRECSGLRKARGRRSAPAALAGARRRKRLRARRGRRPHLGRR